MPSTSVPDHAKKEALQYLNGFGENFLTSCMHTMHFHASYTGSLSQPHSLFLLTSVSLEADLLLCSKRVPIRSTCRRLTRWPEQSSGIALSSVTARNLSFSRKYHVRTMIRRGRRSVHMDCMPSSSQEHPSQVQGGELQLHHTPASCLRLEQCPDMTQFFSTAVLNMNVCMYAGKTSGAGFTE